MRRTEPGRETEEKFGAYAQLQKQFWSVEDEQTARFRRVICDPQRSEATWRASAEKDVYLLLAGIRPEPHWTLLEIGCGTGRILDRIRQRCAFQRLIGVDLSESMLRFARQSLGADERILLFGNNGYSLAQVPAESVEFAYAVHVFIHIRDSNLLLQYLQEVHRLLKGKGLFRFNVRCFDPTSVFSNSLGGRFAKLMYKLGVWSAGGHTWSPGETVGFEGNRYTPREIRGLIRKSGLIPRSIQSNGAHFWCTAQKPSSKHDVLD